MFYSKKYIAPVKLLLGVFFLGAVLIPLITMLAQATGSEFAAVASSLPFRRAVVNSLTTATTATAISVLLAFVFSFALARSGIKRKNLFSVLATFPMLIPSISHGMGLQVLLGNNGMLTNLLKLDVNIYGFWGIVIGSVMYSFPIAFLMLYDVVRMEDGSPYEAADVLGISRPRQFAAITLPYLSKPMISVIFATFTVIVTDYGVVKMVGGNTITLPLMMYTEAVGRLNFNTGSIIGTFLLIPAIVAFVADVLSQEKAKSGFVTQRFRSRPNKKRDVLCAALCGLINLVTALPILAFIPIGFLQHYPSDMTLTFNNVLKSLDMGAGRYFTNSLIIAFFTALVGVVLSYTTGYLTARLPDKFSQFLHLFAITSLAVPGLVLGLSYAMVFSGTPLARTLTILVIVNIIHFFSSPYLMAYNSLGIVNGNLEAVGRTLGVGRLRIVRDVIIPQTLPTILEMFSYFFVNSMMTISAVSFLYATQTQPLAMMIPRFEGQTLLGCAAIVSLIILVTNIVMKSIVSGLKRVLRKRGMRV